MLLPLIVWAMAGLKVQAESFGTGGHAELTFTLCLLRVIFVHWYLCLLMSNLWLAPASLTPNAHQCLSLGIQEDLCWIPATLGSVPPLNGVWACPVTLFETQNRITTLCVCWTNNSGNIFICSFSLSFTLTAFSLRSISEKYLVGFSSNQKVFVLVTSSCSGDIALTTGLNSPWNSGRAPFEHCNYVLFSSSPSRTLINTVLHNFLGSTQI